MITVLRRWFVPSDKLEEWPVCASAQPDLAIEHLAHRHAPEDRRGKKVQRRWSLWNPSPEGHGYRGAEAAGGDCRIAAGGSTGEARDPAGEPLKARTGITSFGFLARHDIAKRPAYAASASDPHAPVLARAAAHHDC